MQPKVQGKLGTQEQRVKYQEVQNQLCTQNLLLQKRFIFHYVWDLCWVVGKVLVCCCKYHCEVLSWGYWKVWLSSLGWCAISFGSRYHCSIY